MSARILPEVGMRIVHSGDIGTVKYVGPVDGTQGTWLGIEWDDPKRGKHDGVKGGRRYFSCLVPNAGSFIRPSPAVSYGTSFLNALISKYVEVPRGAGMETVVLGSSRGAIEVEAVNLDKIRGNLSQLERLREVSLDNERVATSDEPGKIRKTCPGIRGLDLSKSLLPSWDVVTLIVGELPILERLALNWNRLQMPTKIPEFRCAFGNLKELQINATMISWTDIRRLTSYMPQLQLLETGYNRFQRLDNADLTIQQNHAKLTVVNFDSNELTDWTATCEALLPFTGLRRLILSSNQLSTIDAISNAPSSLFHLKHLALASNYIKAWTDIDRIPLWCPQLESLTLAENPLLEDKELGRNARQFIIAKIPSLVVLDAAQITPKERTDCELFYLSYINKHGPVDDNAMLAEHPRWKELCEKHGRPYSLLGAQEKHDTLRNRLIQITVQQCARSPATQPQTDPEVSSTQSLRVLPSMTARTLRMKLVKTFKIARSQQASMRLWLKMPDGAFAEIETEDTHDLTWLGVEDNSLVLLVIG